MLKLIIRKHKLFGIDTYAKINSQYKKVLNNFGDSIYSCNLPMVVPLSPSKVPPVVLAPPVDSPSLPSVLPVSSPSSSP